MFAKNSKAYSVYLLFRFVFSLAVSMSTVLFIVSKKFHLYQSNLIIAQLIFIFNIIEFVSQLEIFLLKKYW